MYESTITLPIRVKKTAPTDAKLTAWNPKILLNLIMPAKIRTEFRKFKITTRLLKDLLMVSKIIWIAEIIKKSPRNEFGKISKSSKPLLPDVKFSQFNKPKLSCVANITNKASLKFLLTSFFWL